MNNELLATLEYIEQERGISKEQLVDAVEKAILTASRKSIHPASMESAGMDAVSLEAASINLPNSAEDAFSCASFARVPICPERSAAEFNGIYVC